MRQQPQISCHCCDCSVTCSAQRCWFLVARVICAQSAWSWFTGGQAGQALCTYIKRNKVEVEQNEPTIGFSSSELGALKWPRVWARRGQSAAAGHTQHVKLFSSPGWTCPNYVNKTDFCYYISFALVLTRTIHPSAFCPNRCPVQKSSNRSVCPALV